MINQIKMEVTPDLSKRVQEIVFANCGSWNTSKNKIVKYTDRKFIYINEKALMWANDDIDYFKNHSFKEVSAYDFITSQGQQEWLPKYNEEALFSDDGKDWHKRKFKAYIPNNTYSSFLTSISTYNYCKKIPKTISFVQFLKDNNCYKEYIFNSKIENQRWSVVSNYTNPEELKILEPVQWIDFAFNFDFQKETKRFWITLNKKWVNIIEQNSNLNIIWGE